MSEKKALVTGATRGLGRAMAVHLSRKGYDVVVTGRSEADLAATIELMEPGAHESIAADLATNDGCRSVIDACLARTSQSGLSVFIHCASSSPDPDTEASLADTTLEVVQEHVATAGLSGVVLLKGLEPALTQAPLAHAVLISTDWILQNTFGPPAFAASKALATQVWRSAQKEFLSKGCILSVLICGDIATYDQEWENAKWTLDSTADEVTGELGTSRVLISDVLAATDLIVDAQLAAVTEITIRPIDPSYAP